MKRIVIEGSNEAILSILPGLLSGSANILIEDLPDINEPKEPQPRLSAPADPLVNPPAVKKYRRTLNGLTPEDIILATLADGAFYRADSIVAALKRGGFSGSYSSIHNVEQKGLVERRKDHKNVISYRLRPKD